MNAWTKGLVAGGISGACGGVINVFAAIGIAPESFNLHTHFHNTLILLGIGAVCSAIIGVAAYLQKSPLPSGK